MKYKPGYFRNRLREHLKENKQPLNEQPDFNEPGCGDPLATNYVVDGQSEEECIYPEGTQVHIFGWAGPFGIYGWGAIYGGGWCNTPVDCNQQIYEDLGSPTQGQWITNAPETGGYPNGPWSTCFMYMGTCAWDEDCGYSYAGQGDAGFNNVWPDETGSMVGGWATNTFADQESGGTYYYIPSDGYTGPSGPLPVGSPYIGGVPDQCSTWVEVLGCTNFEAINFDPFANTDDGSCEYPVDGCTDPVAMNYDPNANTDDGSCEFGTYHQWQFCGQTEGVWEDMLVCPTWDFGSCYDTVEGFDVLSPEGQNLMHQQFYELVGSPAVGTAISIPDAGWYGGYPQIDSVGNINLPYFCIQYLGETNEYPASAGQMGLEFMDTAFQTDCGSKEDCDMVYGCMDETAINYNPEATWSDPNNVFDGACIPGIPGCMDPTALNYNPEANVDDGSCIAIVEGCTNPEAFNYNPEANVDDGSCIAVILGCTDETMINYNPEANTDDGSCIPFVFGCADPQAYNYDEEADCCGGGNIMNPYGCNDVANICCEYPEEVEGCTDEEAINYIGDKVMEDPTINVTDDGSCYYVEGCTDEEAANYNEEADFDDGSCYYNPGCTDPLAVNYDETADFDDGSCIPVVLGCTDENAVNYNELANTDDGSCYYNPGCTNPESFNYDETADFDDGSCIPFIYGCTDPTALNYNELANTDDGSCIPVIEGCTDPSAFNYNPEANTDDGSCIGVVTGCTDENAINYNPEANTDDGSCYYNPGCTDPTALNYNPDADFDDGSCIPVIEGCTDPEAVNYDETANTDDGSCYYNPGCTDPEAFNYDPEADFDDGSCVGVTNGCTDPEAVNYNPEANTDDGSCYYNPGCTDETAFNYDPEADFDDGSCIPVIPGCTDPEAVNYDETANTDDGTCYGYDDLDCNNFENDLTEGEQAWLCRSCAQGSVPEIISQLCDCCPVFGCTDPEAVNYDSTATNDDGSCEYGGCTDGNAINFDDNADVDDGSCLYRCGPCGDVNGDGEITYSDSEMVTGLLSNDISLDDVACPDNIPGFWNNDVGLDSAQAIQNIVLGNNTYEEWASGTTGYPFCEEIEVVELGWECTLCGGCIETEYGPFASESECYNEGACSNAFLDSAYEFTGMPQTNLNGYVWTEQNMYYVYCMKCNSESIPSPLGDACGCCDPDDIDDINNPWSPENSAFTCDTFNTLLNSQEQSIMCCACDDECSFVQLTALPSQMWSMCECCSYGDLRQLDFKPSSSDISRIVSKLKGKIGKTKSPQFDRLKELAGLKK